MGKLAWIWYAAVVALIVIMLFLPEWIMGSPR